MVSDSKFSSDDTFLAVTRIIGSDGILSLFSCLSGMLAKQVPYTAVKQVSFDVIAKKLYHVALSVKSASASSKLALSISLSSAFLTSILSCLASQPGDMILTTMCQRSHTTTEQGSQNEHVSAIQATHAIYKTHGLKGFFIGTYARLFHIVAIVTIQLVIYDIIKQLLGLAATGLAH
jgi:solute carrier family 25 phosphate transporter 3